MQVHREHDGSWAECLTPAGCALPIHLPDVSVAEAQKIPLELLLPLLEAFDPPHYKNSYGKYWYSAESDVHRDFDLPAVIAEDGGLQWWTFGEHHRDGDRPATVSANGAREWRQHGKLHRDNDQPAIINELGVMEWWQHGVMHREDGPAVVYPGGNREWWHKGMIRREEWPNGFVKVY